MKAKLLTLGGILVSASSVYALQTYPMADQQKTDVIFSKESFTRISVENDRIQQVFGADGLIEIQSDDEQGQLFLKPSPAFPGKPVSITIVTEGGITQDIRLLPRGVDAQSVLFKPEEIKEDKPIPVQSETDDLVRLMDGMVHGHFLPEFDKKPLSDCHRREIKGLEVQGVSVFEGEDLRGEIYTVKNVSDLPMTLTEETVSESQDKALLLVHKQLSPKQQTRLYVIRKGGFN